MSCEGTIGMITITHKAIVRGRLFDINQQYCYKEVKAKKFGCGCNGTAKTRNFYVVEIDGITYELDERYVVESNVLIPIENQDLNRTREIGDTFIVKSFNELLSWKPDPDEIRAAANDIPM